VRDFVILHYHASERDDSEFWRAMQAVVPPETLTHRIDIFRDRGLLYQVGADEYFSMASWMAVMVGQGVQPRMANPLYALQNLPRAAAALEATRSGIAQAAEALPTHEAYLRSQAMWKDAA
jgi:tryptophan 7-halogenase